MNPAKKAYLERIRSESSYPTFRSLVKVIAVILYTFGVIVLVASLIIGLMAMANSVEHGAGIIFGGLILGISQIITGKVFQETSYMLTDIADSITDLNCRYEQ